jgi:hypothetical protein
MSLKLKVNNLIDIFERQCRHYCKSSHTRDIPVIELKNDITFTFNIDIGLMMLFTGIWYTDEEKIRRVTAYTPNMREKLYELVEKEHITIEELEKMIFKGA